MTKIQGLLRSTLILCLFLSVKVEKAEAFFLIPPLPPEPVVDFPDEGGKIVSVVQAAYQKVQSIDSKLATLRLDAIKKGDLFAIKQALSVVNALTEKNTKKAPNKGTVPASTELNIKGDEKGLLDEEAFFNAHNALFFTFPSLEDYESMFKKDDGYKADYAFMQTVYKQKAAQYRQDVLIDTYLTARMMEDYLVTVERTLNRLDACQKKPDPDKCTFFGMTMAEVKSTDEAPTGGDNDNNPGHMGAATNAYIVTMVYDRLMRIVEDLTATEALYQSAKQTDMADPVHPKGSQKSSAEDYIPVKYHFAYTEKHEHSYAKGLLNKDGLKRLECTPGKDGCPSKNEEGKAKKMMDDTEILTKIQPLDNILTEAVTIHNIKNQLPTYKVQYRKYLRSIENHKRALQAVHDSDQCVVSFFMRHDANIIEDPETKKERKLTREEWNEFWGTAKGTGEQKTEDGHVFDYEKDYNDYEKRGGMSLALIEEYQARTQNTILGTTGECEGYYPEGQCADGYKSDTDQPCSADKSLFPCVLENAVEFDANTPSSLDSDNINTSLENGVDDLAENQKGSLSFDEKDYVASNGDIQDIANDNRVRTETPWRIGAEKIIEMTGRLDHKILFNPWNDQKDFQIEYLRQKYHNITNIIKTTDKGWASFKITQSLSRDPDEPEDETDLQNEITALVQGGQACLSVNDALPKAKQDICKDYPSSEYECTVEPHADTGKISFTITKLGKEAVTHEEEKVVEEGTGTLDEDETIEDVEEDICGEYEDSEDTTCEVEEGDEEGEYSYKITQTIEVEDEPAEAGGEVVKSGNINQFVSKAGGNCTYTKSSAPSFSITPQSGENCDDLWDFTKDFLVRRYLQCAVENGASGFLTANDFYKDARDNKGRIVARNKLNDVMWTRIGTAAVIKATVEDYQLKMEALGSQLSKVKELMTSYNKTVDTSTEEKNIIQKLKEKSERRIKSIEDEIKNIEDRSSKVNIESDKCALEYRKAGLINEKSCIESGLKNFACPASCANLKEEQKPERCRDESRVPNCYDKDEGYVVSLNDAIKAQKELDRINTENNKKEADEAPEEIPEDVKKAINKHIVPMEAAPQLEAKDREITAAQNKKKALQADVDKLQEEIDDVAMKFMSEEGKHFNDIYTDKVNQEYYKWNKNSKIWALAGYYNVTREQASYIVTSKEEQAKIEGADAEFESFLNRKDDDRMTKKDAEKICPDGCPDVPLVGCLCQKIRRPIGSDNLATSLNEFYHGAGTADTIYSNMKTKWWDDAFDKYQFGDEKFTIDDSFALLKLEPKQVTLKEVMEQVSKMIMIAASEKMAANITEGDKIIDDEMKAAVKDVKDIVTDYFGISYNEEDQTYQIPTEQNVADIINHSNYQDWNGKRLEVKKRHIKLIGELRKPHTNVARLEKAGIDVAKIYGIPEGIENTCGTVTVDNEAHKEWCGRPIDDATNDKYFVGLPARGYIEEEDYAHDDFAGKDYMQPNGALPYLPPLREVFYFDAQDYEDLPRQGDNRPSIPHLLNKKFPNHPDGFVSSWEYIPEIWRYLLARPNLRNDGLYQLAFVERNYNPGKLHDLTEGKDASKYSKIIGREGVYPCKLGNTVIDVWAEGGFDGFTFIHGDGLTATNDCKEIALNGKKELSGPIAKENICYLYNKKKKGTYHFCHLLADHGKDKDTHTANGTGDMAEYNDYSELGQFLQAGMTVKGPLGMSISIADNNMFYRDMQADIAKYLTNEDNADNDVNRQKAELSSFKRNILGSFLDTVYAEHSAKKTRDNMRKTVLGSLSGLCKQIHQNGKTIGIGANEESYKDSDEKARDAIDEACSRYLTDGEGKVKGSSYAVGLAFAKIGEKDTQYGVDDEFTKDQDLYGGINCKSGTKSSYYEDIFCKLDDIKAEKLNEAKRLLKEAEGIYQKMADEEGDKQYILDRLTDINDYITMLEKDEDEVIFLTPNMKKGTHGETLGTINVGATESFIESEASKAKANRTVERATDEESITGMDNGSQVVPYCPNY